MTGVKKPLYELGDLVVIATETDEGLIADYGYITGVELNPDYARVRGWWYSAFIVAGNCRGFQEWCPENHIKGRVIHGAQKQDRAICSEVRNRTRCEVNQDYRLDMG
jgi:hypothetical protein